MMRKYGARMLDVGSIEDGGDRGWAVSKAPPGQTAGRLPFISARELHAMCYGPPQLRKSPAAIAMQARRTRVNGTGQPLGQPSGHRPLSRVSTASASAPLLLEDARLQRMGSRHSQVSIQLQQQDWNRPQTAFAIQDWNNIGQLAALQDHSRPYTAQDLVAVVERRLGDDAGRGEWDMIEARSMRSNSRPGSSHSRQHSPGPPSRSSSKGPGSRRSSKGPGSRSSSKGPSRPISAIGSLALSSAHRPSTSSGALALVDKGRRSSKSSRRFSRASRSSRASSRGSHTDDEDPVSPSQKPLKDRKLSSGACLGLDLAAFEHRKSKMLLKSELPEEPKERPNTASRRPSEASSRMSRRTTEVGTPRSKVEEKAQKKGEASSPNSKETKGIFRVHMEAKAKEAFQKRNKGTSVVLGGEDQDPVQLPGHHLLPATVRALDLPTALDMFDHYDKIRAHGSTGLLDRRAFAEMLFAIAQGKEAMTEQWSNAIFDALDFEHRGLLDRDQVLGWEFAMHNNYHSNIRRRFHKVVNDTQVRELLEALAIGSGFRKLEQLLVTKEELWFVVDTGRVPLSRKASDELHAYLSIGHGNEGLDPHEFLNWLFPGRELRTLQQKVDQMRQQQPHVEDLDEEPEPVLQKNYTAPKRPLWENGLKLPIVIEFTIAQNCLSKIHFIEENLEAFSELQLEVTIVFDDTLRETCNKVVAKIGREVCLWDAGTMTPYREDPFETKASSWAWLKKYLMTLCPDAIDASQVAFLKGQKRQLQRMKKATKARRQSSAPVEAPDEP